MKKFWILIGFFLLCISAFACQSDYDCGYGNVCVKPRNSVSYDGVCVIPSDSFGNRDYSPRIAENQPTEVSQCQFNTECALGYSCFKKSGEIYGICMK